MNVESNRVMEKQIQKYLIKLRNVSKIPEKGKIDTTGSDVEIYKGSVVNWIWRWYKGDGRDKAISYFRELYEDVVGISNHIMATDSFDINLLDSLKNQTEASVVGIMNFKLSYKTDEMVTSNIEFILEDVIQPQLKKINEYLRHQGFHPPNISRSLPMHIMSGNNESKESKEASSFSEYSKKKNKKNKDNRDSKSV